MSEGVNAAQQQALVSRDVIHAAIARNKGVLFAEPAMVGRPSYSGRNILAPNSDFSDPKCTDSRGYVPVEWWIMSTTQCLNDIEWEGEGITSLLLPPTSGTQPQVVRLTNAIDVAGHLLMGDFIDRWPLTKILDIGGKAVKPSFVAENADKSEWEEPPIPCHVHAGEIECGKCSNKGKLEAYFFPPVDVPPYNLSLGTTENPIKTRLGIKPGTTKGQVLTCLKCGFAVDDGLYDLLNVFHIKPRTNWTIATHVVHAPGPWPTFEIQLPQDDFNMLAWKLGQPVVDDTERAQIVASQNLRGFDSPEELLKQAIKWERNVDPDFEKHWFRDCTESPLDEGVWGRRLRLFHHNFYGEGFEISCGGQYTRPPSKEPFAGIVWSGRGTLNGHVVDVGSMQHREFLVTPNVEVTMVNTSDTPLLVYTTFPIVTEDHMGPE